MKKKINQYLMLLVTLTLVIALVISTIVFHHIYREQILKDMKSQAEILAGFMKSEEQFEETDFDESMDLRITVIRPDGEIIYDNEADSSQMENHQNRSEVQEAINNGEGFAVRQSKTLNKALYYYAIRLDNNNILRISKEENNVWNLFYYAILIIAFLDLLMILVCFFLSRKMTKSVIDPIEQLANNLDHAEEIETYEELVPFIKTIRKQHEAILDSANMRQEFTANVSHELKTPLTSISGYAELIETGISDEKNNIHFAAEIQKNAQRLLTLINDIIKLSELDAGNLEVQTQAVDLCAISRRCIASLKINADKNNVTLTFSGNTCMVLGDAGMIEELIYNLCDNAIRYNKSGGNVFVSTYVKDGKKVFSVEDTGIGIPEESKDRIFERFYRVDKSHSRATGGTGLGLAIVKHIASVHHAEIELTSKLGEGTMIKVIF